MAIESKFTWMDGELVPGGQASVPFLPAALHSGAAVFEGIRAYKTGRGPAVFRLAEHSRRLIEEFAQRPDPSAAGLAPVEGLTERELEVLQLVAKGLSNAEIATELIMSPATAKTHVSRLLTKLGARDRTQLVTIAYETGVAVPGRG